MAYPIEKKLVIAVASSALFDLTESDSIFRAQGLKAYKEYQNKNVNKPFDKGVAYPFIKRLLSLNTHFPDEKPVEVVLMSKNSPETGLRAFNSIAHYGLDITRAGFTSGQPHFKYLPSFNTSLFLSANKNDVEDAIAHKLAAGMVLNTTVIDEDEDNELRIAFDFDGVLADDESEKIYQNSGLSTYQQYESERSSIPLNAGPVVDLLKKISFYQKLEARKAEQDSTYKPMLKTAIVTARNAPVHTRMINTLNSWGIDINEAFFLGGIDKSRVLNVMRPHIYFDDQMGHLDHLDKIPAVHIPFGVVNNKK
ncbi:MAG: 5'-nucleotidase [Paludibacteraceae bacterium]|nr:5'-nucleotidase [Paludibacteraceae bacterium]